MFLPYLYILHHVPAILVSIHNYIHRTHQSLSYQRLHKGTNELNIIVYKLYFVYYFDHNNANNESKNNENVKVQTVNK